MLIIITSHPIQYQVPLWQALARDGRLPFEVWYLTDHGVAASHDREFGRAFAWDLPMLEGYPHRFLKVNPGWVMDSARPHGIRLAESLEPNLRTIGATSLMVTGWHKLAIWQAVEQARRAGLKIWLRAESNNLAPNVGWRRWARRRYHRLFFRQVDEFLCIGSANRRLYIQSGIPEERLWPAPYSVDNDRFARQAAQLRPDRAAIRHGWMIPENAFCVLFCGKFIPKKRPLDLVTAAVRWSQQDAAGHRPIHLLFVGSGEMDEALRSHCEVRFDAAGGPLETALAASGRPPASFAGFLNQTEISRAYVAADALVLPSDAGETWGLVVNEALASGLPCAASAAAGCSEDLVAPLGASLRFPLGDIAALVAALQSLAVAPPAAEALHARVQEFGQEVTVRNLVELGARCGAELRASPVSAIS